MNKSVTYENRYKHKLNMLEPGTAILKWTGVFLSMGLVLLLLRLSIPAYIMLGMAGVLVVILSILLIIEAHQDRVLNEIAARENKQDGE